MFNPLATDPGDRTLLDPYLRDGRVDYVSLGVDLDRPALITHIADRDLSMAGREEALAFYLNAYNLLVLCQVLDILESRPHWPGPLSLIAKVRFFALRRHRVAGRRMSLMYLENRVIRRRFRDPRIHFALNCASVSCPPLPGRLFVAEHLATDLEALTSQFLDSDAVSYDAAGHTLRVSRLFRWYRRDFDPSVVDFIAAYREDVPRDVKLLFHAWDWSLNAQPAM